MTSSLSSRAGLRHGRLSAARRAEFYRTYAVPKLRGFQPQEQPTAVFIAGQPGAGKTTLQGRWESRLELQAFSLDGDDYVTNHPHYADFALVDDRTATTQVDGDAMYWIRRVREDVRARRLNLVMSAPLAAPDWSADAIQAFADEGYRTHLVVIATHPAISRLSIVDRYQGMRDDDGYGRWVAPEWHERHYEGLPESIEVLELGGFVDSIDVVDRNGTSHYHNELDADGEWARHPGSWGALRAARERAWTPEETRDFAEIATALLDPHRAPERLADDLRPLVEEAVAQGEEHVGHPLQIGAEREPAEEAQPPVDPRKSGAAARHREIGEAEARLKASTDRLRRAAGHLDEAVDPRHMQETDRTMETGQHPAERHASSGYEPGPEPS